jgi:hypothetical protein
MPPLTHVLIPNNIIEGTRVFGPTEIFGDPFALAIGLVSKVFSCHQKERRRPPVLDRELSETL